MTADKKRFLVNSSAVKKFVKAKGKNSARDLHEHVSRAVETLLAEAVLRAEGNGRATVRGTDI